MKNLPRTFCGLNKATFFIQKLGSKSISTELPIVPIIDIRISPLFTLDRLLILMASFLDIKVTSEKSILPLIMFLEVMKVTPSSRYLGDSCVPSRTSQIVFSFFTSQSSGITPTSVCLYPSFSLLCWFVMVNNSSLFGVCRAKALIPYNWYLQG